VCVCVCVCVGGCVRGSVCDYKSQNEATKARSGLSVTESERKISPLYMNVENFN
jgi:hypothetical protein